MALTPIEKFNKEYQIILFYDYLNSLNFRPLHSGKDIEQARYYFRLASVAVEKFVKEKEDPLYLALMDDERFVYEDLVYKPVWGSTGRWIVVGDHNA